MAPFQSAPGERCGTILILDDVTERVRLEEQLQHAEKMASVGLLAAGVAHEVNTPLAGISSYTQLLRGQLEESDPRQEVLEKIEKQSFRAAKIVNGLLNFSRSSGTEFDQVDVNKVLLDVLSLVEHQLDGSKIRVRKELDRGAADRARQREPAAAGVLQPGAERPRRHAERRLADARHLLRERHPHRRGEATPATASAASTSAASTTRSSPRRASARERVSASASRTASSRSTAARSSSTARRGRGRRSASPSRRWC